MNDITPCIKNIFDGDEKKNPLFQVIEIKSLKMKDSNEIKYLIALNDTANYCTAKLNSRLENLITDNQLNLYQIIRATNYNLNSKKNIILNEIEILPEKYSGIIGDPASLKELQTQENFDTISKSSTLFKISSLNPHLAHWTIQAKVVYKSPVKEWENLNSAGQFFSIIIKDQIGTEIRGTFFNDEVDKFKDLIILNKVYLFTDGRIKTANRKYSNIDNEYEITFDKSTKIKESATLINSEPSNDHNFTKLNDLSNKKPDSFVDLLGIIISINKIEEVHSIKFKKDYTKRDFVIIDESNLSVQCTLWGDDAKNFSESNANKVIQINNAKVVEFHGKSISITSNSTLTILDRSNQLAAPLFEWYESNAEKLQKNSAANNGADTNNGQSDDANDSQSAETNNFEKQLKKQIEINENLKRQIEEKNSLIERLSSQLNQDKSKKLFQDEKGTMYEVVKKDLFIMKETDQIGPEKVSNSEVSEQNEPKKFGLFKGNRTTKPLILIERCSKDKSQDDQLFKGESIQKLIDEFKIMVQLNHPNVLKAHGVFINEDSGLQPSILLEYCPLNIEYAVKNSMLTKVQQVYSIFQIASGMKYIHSHRIIHGNLCPSSIMIADDGTVKIGDFVNGRPLNSETKNDEADDVYSFGVVAYFILSGGKVPENGGEVDFQSFSLLAKQLVSACLYSEIEKMPTFETICDVMEKNDFDLLPLSQDESSEVSQIIDRYKTIISQFSE